MAAAIAAVRRRNQATDDLRIFVERPWRGHHLFRDGPRVTRPAVLVFVVALAWAAAGCGPAFLLRVPDAPRDCGRIAAGPAAISVFEFDAGGGLKPRGDWTY